MLERARVLAWMFVGAAVLIGAWSLRPVPPLPPVTVVVAASTGADARERAIERAVELAEARRLGWVDADPVIGRRLVANLRFLGRTGTEQSLLDEARLLGMDLTDVVVTGRLLDRMERMLTAPPAPPTDAELAASLATHADLFRSPGRVHVQQVFLARGRGATLSDDAVATLALLRAGGSAVGDPLLDLRADEETTVARLSARYGDAMGAAVRDAALQSWVGPVSSPFGLHLVRVVARTPGQLPPLSTVRAAVVQAWAGDRAAGWRATRMTRLRDRWPVVVEVTP